MRIYLQFKATGFGFELGSVKDLIIDLHLEVKDLNLHLKVKDLNLHLEVKDKIYTWDVKDYILHSSFP